MVSLFAYLLLGTAFAVSLWTIVDSVTRQLPRMRELLDINPIQPLPQPVPVRVIARSSLPARRSAAFPLREAA